MPVHPATVTARHVALSAGPRLLPTASTSSSRPACASASSARTGQASRRCCAPWPGSSARSRCRVRLPAVGRRSATSPRKPTAARARRSPRCRARRTVWLPRRRLDAATAAIAAGLPQERHDELRAALELWLALGAADRDAARRRAADLGLPALRRPPDVRALRRAAARVDLAALLVAASTSSCWTSRPTTSTTTASHVSSPRSGGCPRPWSFPTTVSSWRAP